MMALKVEGHQRITVLGRQMSWYRLGQLHFVENTLASMVEDSEEY